MTPGLGNRLGAALSGAASTSQNLVEYLRSGGLETGEKPSPHEVLVRRPIFRLRHYFPDVERPDAAAPVLLVPPLMMTAEVWDVSPSTSAVALLDGEGLDPWVIDFGDPSEEPDGHRRNVTDHVLAVGEAIGEIATRTGKPVHIGGYSQGGLFCYQAAAYRGCADVASIFALGSPMHPMQLPLPVPAELLPELQKLSTAVLGQTGLPGWAVAELFRWTDPVKAVRSRVRYVLALHDREALLPREKQRRFLDRDGWITFPGPAIAEVMDAMTNERFLRGGLVFDGRTVSLSELTCPILIFTGSADAFAPPATVRDIVRAAPHAEVHELCQPTGHFGLGVGSRARRSTWPAVAQWVRAQGGDGDIPSELTRLTPDDVEPFVADAAAADGLKARLWRAAGIATAGALKAPGAATEAASRALTTAADLSREALAQAPGLLHLERIGPSSRVSYALLLDQAADRNPAGPALLSGDVALSHDEVRRRVDNVVGRLLAVGVRRGERVGVLLEGTTWPLTATAALNRIGAVVVLLRPAGDLEREARLGEVTRVLTDDAGRTRCDVLGLPVVHLPSLHGLRAPATRPAWFRRNPGLGRDLAFVLFADSGERTRPVPVTNRRWAVSALAAASVAGLTEADTIFSVSPVHHPSGLLLATAASAAAGCRLAVADGFDPETFWTDVRHAGATVVPYTWTMLRALTDRPVSPDERHHPVRAFIGSGMPVSVWRRVEQRFPLTTVLELYAPVRSHAVLANASRTKLGSVGRPLPGTAPARVVAVDTVTGRPVVRGDGFLRPADDDEVGMLLVAYDGGPPPRGGVLRDAFRPGDVWVATGDLMHRDADGDHWFHGRVGDRGGAVRTRDVEDALGHVDALDLAACFAEDDERAVAAVTARPGHEVSTRALNEALGRLAPELRPHEVRLVDHIPVSWAFRPEPGRLDPEDALRRWRRDGRGQLRSVSPARVRTVSR